LYCIQQLEKIRKSSFSALQEHFFSINSNDSY
jgi:hypothetical protein